MSVLGKCRWKSGSKSKQGEKSRNRKIIGLKEIKTALQERLCRKSDIKQEKISNEAENISEVCQRREIKEEENARLDLFSNRKIIILKQ